MEKKRITEAVVRRLQPPASGSTIVFDNELRRFGVRITAAGVVAYILEYRIHGRGRSLTLGRPADGMSVADARKAAMAARQKINAGIDPQEERRGLGKQPTFGDLIDDYLASGEFGKKRDSTKRDYHRMAEKILRPRLGKLRLQAVDRRDVERLHKDMKPTPYAANRVLALISVLFTYAIEADWVMTNPCAKVERFPEDQRNRYLSQEEIARFSAALDAYADQQAADVLRLLLLTGARLSEVLKADWSQFDLQRRVWGKLSHHVKSKKQTETPLVAPAVELLTRMHAASGHSRRALLFPGRDGSKARVTIRRPWIQALKAAGLVEVVEVQGKRKMRDGQLRILKRYEPLVRIHDLRHSFVSHLVLNGVPLKTAGALVGHTQVATTNRYANLTNDDLREAADKFTNVLPFRKPA